jgi:hypothetical protein
MQVHLKSLWAWPFSIYYHDPDKKKSNFTKPWHAMHVPDQHHLETKVIYDCSVIAGNSEHESALRTHHDQYNASKAN